MTWYDVDDILYDGTKEEISNLQCPDCGSEISYEFTETVGVFTIKCVSCGYFSRGSGSPIPNCVKLYGDKYTIPKSIKKGILNVS